VKGEGVQNKSNAPLLGLIPLTLNLKFDKLGLINLSSSSLFHGTFVQIIFLQPNNSFCNKYVVEE